MLVDEIFQLVYVLVDYYVQPVFDRVVLGDLFGGELCGHCGWGWDGYRFEGGLKDSRGGSVVIGVVEVEGESEVGVEVGPGCMR